MTWRLSNDVGLKLVDTTVDWSIVKQLLVKCNNVMYYTITLVNVYVDLLVFTRIAGTS